MTVRLRRPRMQPVHSHIRALPASQLQPTPLASCMMTQSAPGAAIARGTALCCRTPGSAATPACWGMRAHVMAAFSRGAAVPSWLSGSALQRHQARALHTRQSKPTPCGASDR
eukprot:jgi/Ulvmu1/6977/UM033_0035.1